MVTFTINVPPMLAYIPYIDSMGTESYSTYTSNAKICQDMPRYVGLLPILDGPSPLISPSLIEGWEHV